MAEIWSSHKRQFKLWQRYRRIAPEEGFVGEGKWLRWLPIPRYIVECETEGYGNVPGSKGPRMSAVNASSGAEGAAQLLGWNNPWPVVTASDYVAYWEEAAYVMAVQGSSAWACA
jgi:hypothetical protein